MTRHRAGVAMLMALATLVLVLAGITAGLVALRGARQSTWSSAVDGRLLAGLRQGELLAVAWLKSGAADVVLPPDGGGISLVDDRFLMPSGEGRLTVVAYDGLAGVPACLAQRGGAMRSGLPAGLLNLAVPAISPARAEASAHLLDSLDLPDGVRRFPVPPLGSGRVWRSADAVAPLADPVPASLDGKPDASLAEAIAFHSDGRINLNTAPEPVLRAAYSVLGLSGLDEVLERRRLLQASKVPAGTSSSASGVRLVAQSDRWQMLISVRWQDIHRSWWVVFAGTPQAPAMVQRHDVGN